ncbi:hypothetical protein AB0K52_00195 [Glycomyces sp. NPDC049804]|uniref:hypothetical protein n=1 Tax=Glycomyces sp. NPDC049804 TaxID=3154363 RepID=UPI0034436379
MSAAPVGKQQHPALAAVLVTVVAIIFLAFPIALWANATELINGYRASHGEAGVPGTATVETMAHSKSGPVCIARFTPADGGPAVELRIETPGSCELGQQFEARFMEGHPSPFSHYGEPRLWASGSNDWMGYIPLVILFGLFSLPLLLLLAMLATKLATLALRGRRASEL